MTAPMSSSNKSTLKSTLLALTLLVTSSAAAFAHDLSDISRTQSRQIEQIVQARNSGQLTRREYNQLMAEQTRIAQMQENLQRGGYVTGRDHHVLRVAQQEAAQHIYQESHDGEVNYLRVWRSKHGYR